MSAVIDIPKFSELLQALEGGDNEKMKQAESMYQQARKTETANVAANLLAVVASDNIPEPRRFQAAVLLRQVVTPAEGDSYDFARVPQQLRQDMAAELLRRYEVESIASVRKKIGEVIEQVVEGAWDPNDQRGWVCSGQAGWPAFLQLIIQMANPATNQNVESCHCSLMLLKTLVGRLSSEVVSAQQQVGGIIQSALGHADTKIRCAGTLLVCEMVCILDKSDWAPLRATAGPMLQVMQGLAQSKANQELESCLQAYTMIIEMEPDFFKNQLSESLQPAQFLSDIVKAGPVADSGIRQLSLEWLTTFAEKKPKWITKNLPSFGVLVLECCMALLLEISDDQSELKAWVERMDDEEGEEDADELCKVGEECIDRFLEAVGMDYASKDLFQLVGRFISQDQWQAKHAALAAVKQTVEYVEEAAHVDEVTKLMLSHVDHSHPRVRYIALHALGQLAHDQAPQFQDAWHKTVMPAFLTKMDDSIDKVASMAMSSFVCFAEELDRTIMIDYSSSLMQKLVAKLQSTNHRMVQEESITAIAVIAGTIEEDFCQYYDGMMPLLKTFVMNATAENQQRLRGKAFECMSLLGLAVGKEKFLPDARDAVAEMLKTSQTLEADNMQKEYMHEASERICRCLKRDFAQFVPHLLPSLLKCLDISQDSAAATEGAIDDDDEQVTVRIGDGKLVKVHTSRFEEMDRSFKMINTLCEHIQGAFLQYVPTVAKVLVPLFNAHDETTMLCDDARAGAFVAWGGLIKCAREGAAESGQDGKMVSELLSTALEHMVAFLKEEVDADARDAIASCLALSLKNAGPGLLSGSQVLQLVRQLFALIDESIQRTADEDKAKKKKKSNVPADLQQDEDGDSDADDGEEQLRTSLQEALGAAMETHPAEFLQCLPECSVRLTQWLQSKEQTPLGLFLAADMVRHLKEQSQPTWPVFIPAVFQALKAKEAEVRVPALYVINVAAQVPDFKEAAPEAFRMLAQVVSAPTSKKKKDDREKIASENAVAALLALSRYQGPQCPPDVTIGKCWELVLSKLPLKEDVDEAKMVHGALVDLVAQQDATLMSLGAAHLGKALSCLSEVYRQSDISTKEIDDKILQVFKMLPQDKLMEMASCFSEKQQKKIQKMVSS